MSLRIHPTCYSFAMYNLLAPFDGHYTVLIARPHLETFTFYKMGEFGNFTSFPAVPFAVPEFTDEMVTGMRFRVLQALKRELRYHGAGYQASPDIYESILAWGDNKNPDIQKRWGLLPHFDIPDAAKFVPLIYENVTNYLTFTRPEGDTKTLLVKHSSTKPINLRNFIKRLTNYGYTYLGRGDFDSWLNSTYYT